MSAPRRRKLTQAQKAEILAAQNNRCTICGEDLFLPVEWDHVAPLSMGGADDPANIQCLHLRCHRDVKCKADARALAKAKRLERFMETGRHRNRKSRPIQSRGFDKRFRKRMDGTVERKVG